MDDSTFRRQGVEGTVFDFDAASAPPGLVITPLGEDPVQLGLGRGVEFGREILVDRGLDVAVVAGAFLRDQARGCPR